MENIKDNLRIMEVSFSIFEIYLIGIVEREFKENGSKEMVR